MIASTATPPPRERNVATKCDEYACVDA